MPGLSIIWGWYLSPFEPSALISTRDYLISASLKFLIQISKVVYAYKRYPLPLCSLGYFIIKGVRGYLLTIHLLSFLLLPLYLSRFYPHLISFCLILSYHLNAAPSNNYRLLLQRQNNTNKTHYFICQT